MSISVAPHPPLISLFCSVAASIHRLSARALSMTGTV